MLLMRFDLYLTFSILKPITFVDASKVCEFYNDEFHHLVFLSPLMKIGSQIDEISVYVHDSEDSSFSKSEKVIPQQGLDIPVAL